MRFLEGVTKHFDVAFGPISLAIVDQGHQGGAEGPIRDIGQLGWSCRVLEAVRFSCWTRLGRVYNPNQRLSTPGENWSQDVMTSRTSSGTVFHVRTELRCESH